ncbi:ABC transporter substrate-binding protein [Euzebya rosea]|uniref:ABC transporter substrate-binding protein n=1 Tax=Euzebya rosea TaxID=2052804 RepID=UPI000D3ECB9A|nr:ABC transporter substrate-binding protein [Euzebya rosea]
MTTNLKWLRLVAMIALLAIVATACASDSGDETDEDAGDAATEETVDEPTEEEATDEATEEEEPAEEATTEEAAEEPAGDGAENLKMAYILPETGQLAFLGPPIINGFQLAVQQINEAGGVNGAEVLQDGGDEGDGDGTIANQTADRLLAEDVHVIMGAASSGISLTIIDKITGAGVVQCSPSNTSPTFTNYDDGGLYFRAAPTDALQGPVLAEQIVAAGGTNVAVLARADDYGQGLLDATVAALENAGATVAVETTYDPMAQSFDAEVEQVVNSGADAVALIAFDEGARILSTMIERGVGPADIVVFGADGIASNDTPGLVDPNNPAVLAGMRTTSPTPASDEGFNTALSEFAPDVTDTLFAAEGYDCAIAAALAAHAGGSNSSQAIADNMIAVTGGGTKCTSFAECKELLDAGEDIDYDGPSGPMDFTEAGEPSQGTYALSEFTAEGTLEQIDTIVSSQ